MATPLGGGLNASGIEITEKGKNANYAIVVADWNSEVTDALLEGAIKALLDKGINQMHIRTYRVPGSFELPLGAQLQAQDLSVKAVICLGCVIQGETPHFDFISQAVANGVTQVGLKYNKPVIFGVLTTLTLEQALDRAGGKHGNKGYEAALTAMAMVELAGN